MRSSNNNHEILHKAIPKSDIRDIMTYMLLYHWVLMKQIGSIQAFQFRRLSHTNGLWSEYKSSNIFELFSCPGCTLPVKKWCFYTHCITDNSNMQVLNCSEEIIFRDGPSKRHYENLSGSYSTSIDFFKANKQIAFLLFYNEGNSFWEINIIASVSFLFCEPSSETF